jgi:AraC-like DNA-binding protein
MMGNRPGPGFQKPAASLRLSPTSALYEGPLLGMGLHRGAVHCFAEATACTLSATTRDGRTTGPSRVVFVPAGEEHRVDGDCSRARFLYLDTTDPLADRLISSLEAAEERGGLLRSDRSLLGEPALHTAPVTGNDPRVRAVLRAFHAGDGLHLSAKVFASRARLSESRFLHVFRSTMAVPFRRYRLWARMRFAALAIAQGATLTEAALRAGFATPSHFSASFRAMFGAPPSILSSMDVSLCGSVAR